MKISTKGRYALRLMLDLAIHNTGEAVSLKDIAKRQGISDKYLEQIISVLNKAGFVKSIRGAQGGYLLKKKPEEYTVGMILKLTEGTLAPVGCVGDDAEEGNYARNRKGHQGDYRLHRSAQRLLHQRPHPSGPAARRAPRHSVRGG